MARKPTKSRPDANQFTTAAPATAAAKAAALGVPVSTPVRNTPMPRPVAVRPAASQDAIARKAFEIYIADKSGSQLEHWLTAERLLRAA